MTTTALKQIELGPTTATAGVLLSRPPALEAVLNAAQASAKPTVLVVDDTPANLTLLANLLNKHYRVLLANSGAKALEIAHALAARRGRARRDDAADGRLRGAAAG